MIVCNWKLLHTQYILLVSHIQGYVNLHDGYQLDLHLKPKGRLDDDVKCGGAENIHTGCSEYKASIIEHLANMTRHSTMKYTSLLYLLACRERKLRVDSVEKDLSVRLDVKHLKAKVYIRH